MWILESDADFLQGKRMWLKPGKKYLFGRVKRDGVRFAIDHKTISRKHFVITVDEVKPGDAARVHARSRVTIADEKSKQGTFVDGELLKDDTRELMKSEHSIRPGAFHHELSIKWQPCVLTFSFTKKELKADALRSKRERLEELDVKVISDYLSASTTHVVAGKRNTAKGLQAIIQGKYIVADSFVDALIYAATPADLGEEENLSPLEQDFDTTWPKEIENLPPAGKEPTVRPAESYAPNPARNSVFEKFTFVFGDSRQHENLLPPITLGHGKALLYQVVNGQTTVDELVEYMRNAAGQKSFGDVQRDTDNGGVIMVRWVNNDKYEDWVHGLIDEVAMKLDQRAIEQAEFLDAVLANDAFTLRQTIRSASAAAGRAAPPPTAASFQSVQEATSTPTPQVPSSAKDPVIRQLFPNSHALPPAPAPSLATQASDTQLIPSSIPELEVDPSTNAPAPTKTQPNSGTAMKRPSEAAPPSPAPPPKRSRLRGAPVKKFTDFDDGFDPDSVPLYNPDDIPNSQTLSQYQSEIRSGSLRGSRDVSIAPPGPYEMGDDIDDLLPATAAMKRQRLELDQGPRNMMTGKKTVLPPAPRTKPKTRPQRKEKEIDVLEAARTHRDAEEAAAEKERADLAEGLGYENDDLGKPANLAVVVDMPLLVRQKPSIAHAGDENPRWDPAWNGRKNFKHFKKSLPGRPSTFANGDGRRGFGHTHQVIVPLVEARRPTYGLGERYWDHGDERGESGNEQSKDRNQGREKNSGDRVSQVQLTSQSPSQIGTSARSAKNRADGGGSSQMQTLTQMETQTVVSEQDSDDNPDSTMSQTSPSAATGRLQREAASIVSHAVNLDAPRRTRLADKTQSQNVAAGKKRPLAEKAGGEVRKKQKTIQTAAAYRSDSEDSDELKFRFGRRKKP